MGSESYVHLQLGEFTFIIRVSPDITIKPGDKLNVFLDPSKMYFFDPKTENII